MGFFDNVKKALKSDEREVRDEITEEVTESNEAKNFRYLDDLIHGEAKEIILEFDIVLQDSERSKYPEGIKIDVDDLTINANGHTIDARCKTRIFKSSGKNIIIKNATLKNGFTNNVGGAVLNSGDLTIANSLITENEARKGAAIYNNDGKLTVMQSSIRENAAQDEGGAIYNDGICILENMEFDDGDICNRHHLFIKGKFQSGRKIANKGLLVVDEALSGEVENSGRIHEFGPLDKRQRDFSFLDRLVHAGGSEIELENDILLNVEDSEDESYAGGIEIDIDGLSLEGNGHAIDAQCLARIFTVTGKNVTIRNVIFKNGFCKIGSAINNSGDLMLEDSAFEENTADVGGAINNCGRLAAEGLQLIKNTAKWHGGAINNDEGDMTVKKSVMVQNSAVTDCGGAINNNSQLSIEESILERNTARLGGGAIENNGELKIEQSALSENSAEFAGAIENNMNLTIKESNLCRNVTKRSGGLIRNKKGEIKISDSILNENAANENGGVIENNGILTLVDCTLENNSAGQNGGAVNHQKGNFKIIKSIFSNNTSPNNVISNSDALEIYNTTFNANRTRNLIVIDDESKLSSISNSYIENWVDRSVICNRGVSTIDKDSFSGNLMEEDSYNIINYDYLNVMGIHIDDMRRSILNEGTIFIRDISLERRLQTIINGGGITEIAALPGAELFNFGYLDGMIRESASAEIVLEEDICFEKYERDFFEGGIELDRDGLVIDGDGHTIDAGEKSRIFIITAKNVTLKNIIFKNGHASKNYDNTLNSCGGAIKVNYGANVIVENCDFLSNTSEEDGGAIENNGEMILAKSKLCRNKVDGWGSAIRNFGNLAIKQSQIQENRAKYNGTIYNEGKILIKETKLIENASEFAGTVYNKGEMEMSSCELSKNNGGYGAAVYNKGDLLMSGSAVTENVTAFSGAIHNTGQLEITESAFTANAAGYGGAVNNEEGSMQIEESRFIKNTADFGGAVNVNGGELEMVRVFIEDNSGGHGGAIQNNAKLTIAESSITENHAEYNGTIYNRGELKIFESAIRENRSDRFGGAITNEDGELELTDCELTGNVAGKSGGAISTNNLKYKLNNCIIKDNAPDDINEEN